jgi:hypothetical protein
LLTLLDVRNGRCGRSSYTKDSALLLVRYQTQKLASLGQSVLPLSQARHQTVKPFKQRELHGTVTVKPFEQRELHGTVTIRPELKIHNQQVTQK